MQNKAPARAISSSARGFEQLEIRLPLSVNAAAYPFEVSSTSWASVSATPAIPTFVSSPQTSVEMAHVDAGNFVTEPKARDFSVQAVDLSHASAFGPPAELTRTTNFMGPAGQAGLVSTNDSPSARFDAPSLGPLGNAFANVSRFDSDLINDSYRDPGFGRTSTLELDAYRNVPAGTRDRMGDMRLSESTFSLSSSLGGLSQSFGTSSRVQFNTLAVPVSQLQAGLFLVIAVDKFSDLSPLSMNSITFNSTFDDRLDVAARESAAPRLDARTLRSFEPRPGADADLRRITGLSGMTPLVRDAVIDTEAARDNHMPMISTATGQAAATMPVHNGVDATIRNHQGAPGLQAANSDLIQSPDSRLSQSEPNGASSDVAGSDEGPVRGEQRTGQRGTEGIATIRSAVVAAVGGGTVFAATELANLARLNTIPRAALLANLPFNVEAVDEAIDAMAGEIERLGGELGSWLDEAVMPPWAMVAATAVTVGAVGGRYWRRKRDGQTCQSLGEDESSSWLFTRLEHPAGQR